MLEFGQQCPRARRVKQLFPTLPRQGGLRWLPASVGVGCATQLLLAKAAASGGAALARRHPPLFLVRHDKTSNGGVINFSKNTLRSTVVVSFRHANSVRYASWLVRQVRIPLAKNGGFHGHRRVVTAIER